MSYCTFCAAPAAHGVAIIHVTHEMLRELVDSINRSGLFRDDGARLTVEVVNHARYAPNHVDLAFTVHREVPG
jgi:hypothetical protein